MTDEEVGQSVPRKVCDARSAGHNDAETTKPRLQSRRPTTFVWFHARRANGRKADLVVPSAYDENTEGADGLTALKNGVSPPVEYGSLPRTCDGMAGPTVINKTVGGKPVWVRLPPSATAIESSQGRERRILPWICCAVGLKPRLRRARDQRSPSVRGGADRFAHGGPVPHDRGSGRRLDRPVAGSSQPTRHVEGAMPVMWCPPRPAVDRTGWSPAALVAGSAGMLVLRPRDGASMGYCAEKCR